MLIKEDYRLKPGILSGIVITSLKAGADFKKREQNQPQLSSWGSEQQ
jgi:hypothetical protein